MKYADVRVRLPDAMLHPMQSFIRHEDAVRYEEMVTWRVRPAAGVQSVLFYVEGDLDRYRAAVEAIDTVLEWEMTPIDDDAAHVWACEEIRPETASWRSAFADRHLVVVPPIRYDDDARLGMTIVGDGADLSAMLADVPDQLDVTVAEIGTYDRRGGTLMGSLTDRQLAAVDAALRLGYYEVPREADLAAVADELDCAESTASKLLRRAQREVFTRLLDRYGGETAREPPLQRP